MIKLLELPTLQLEQRVKQEIEENPVLEEEQQTAEESTEDNGMPKEVSMEEYLKKAETPPINPMSITIRATTRPGRWCCSRE